MTFLKRFVAKLPDSWQNELKRIYFRHQIIRNRFLTDEPEYERLSSFIKPGDWVIDIGANVGHYTKRFSEIVGVNGRVISFEPVPTTFALLASNAQLFAYKNVTLVNAAVSDNTDMAGMSIPTFNTGLKNYYEAHLSDDTSKLCVLTVYLDSLSIAHRVSLIKIDAEGNEELVLKGMQALLLRDLPTLIIETSSDKIKESLIKLGYTSKRLNGSPNLLFSVVSAGDKSM